MWIAHTKQGCDWKEHLDLALPSRCASAVTQCHSICRSQPGQRAQWACQKKLTTAGNVTTNITMLYQQWLRKKDRCRAGRWGPQQVTEITVSRMGGSTSSISWQDMLRKIHHCDNKYRPRIRAGTHLVESPHHSKSWAWFSSPGNKPGHSDSRL